MVDTVNLDKLHYEPSRYLLDFYIAGFAYHDGLDVIDELALGKPVKLVAEPDNPFDPNAVAIYYDKRKLGYVPEGKNQILSKFLYFGYQTAFESRIQAVNKENHPERQFRVVVQINDHRTHNII